VHILPFAQEKKEGRKALIFFHTKALKKNKKQTRIELPLRGRGYWITKEKDIFLFQNNKYKLIEKKKKELGMVGHMYNPSTQKADKDHEF
jgi:hypothetical protein